MKQIVLSLALISFAYSASAGRVLVYQGLNEKGNISYSDERRGKNYKPIDVYIRDFTEEEKAYAQTRRKQLLEAQARFDANYEKYKVMKAKLEDASLKVTIARGELKRRITQAKASADLADSGRSYYPGSDHIYKYGGSQWDSGTGTKFGTVIVKNKPILDENGDPVEDSAGNPKTKWVSKSKEHYGGSSKWYNINNRKRDRRADLTYLAEQEALQDAIKDARNKLHDAKSEEQLLFHQIRRMSP